MTTTPFTSPRIPLDTLRDAIAEAVWAHVRPYNVPQVTQRLGLEPGTTEEAGHSKRQYVKKRILDWDEAALIKLARALISEFGAPALSDLLSERTLPEHHRVSELTRRDILKALNPLENLFGDTNLLEGLRIISREPLGGSQADWDAFGFVTLTGVVSDSTISTILAYRTRTYCSNAARLSARKPDFSN